MLKLVDGSLFEAKEQHICHQCNCVTSRASNLALAMFNVFPYANIYAERDNPHTPRPGFDEMGDIIVAGNGDDKRFVINMLAQYYPGRPKFPLSKRDGYQARKAAFAACLEKVALIHGIKSVAFPDHVGCGAAGGDWDEYLKMITDWSVRNPALDVAVYKLPS